MEKKPIQSKIFQFSHAEHIMVKADEKSNVKRSGRSGTHSNKEKNNTPVKRLKQ